MWHQIDIDPVDTLFFRDAKPMEASSMGGGAQWPSPDRWHVAMRSALVYQWPDRQDFEHQIEARIASAKPRSRKTLGGPSPRFGELLTCGPFPMRDEQLFFPTPLDLGPSGYAAPFKNLGFSDLPSGLAPVNWSGPSTKDRPEPWISTAGLDAYLSGNAKEAAQATEQAEHLYCAETRPGIAINPFSQTTEDGKFYQAQQLRLREQNLNRKTSKVTLRAFARCTCHRQGHAQATDVIAKLGKQFRLLFGGDRRVARAEVRRNWLNVPIVQTQGTRIKWTLITPACFGGGWHPSWIQPTSADQGSATTWQVHLRPTLLRDQGESRKVWRERKDKQNRIKARLVGALTGKALHVSGWRLDQGGGKGAPKPTRLLVPAGSVYYFEADTPEDAQTLAQTLSGRPVSDHLGEKGFGWGVCSSWSPTR